MRRLPDFPERDPDVATRAHTDANGAAAATTHHLATRVAIDVMASGGNAVDAALAANAVVGVVLPDTCGPGGDLFALVYQEGDVAPSALNASGCAGSGASAARLRDGGRVDVPLRSPWTVTVPGCVDGWEALLARFGTRTLADLLGPAIDAAHAGFEVSTELAASLAAIEPLISSEPSAAAFYPQGRPPVAGDKIRRPDLGATLEAVADGGRDAFYMGPVGEGITAATRGAIVATDLAAVQAEWVEPLGLEVFGMQAWTIPPNSQGYLTLAATWIAQRVADSIDPDDPAYHHALVEAYRAVAWERDDLVADPTTAPLLPAALVDPGRLEALAAHIRPNTPAVWPPLRTVPGGTAYLCVRDSAGLGVSLIQSNFHGIGSGLAAGATGVFLHNRGAGFTLQQGHPNELAPGRRPLHTLSPSLWTHGRELRLILGTRGGQHQPQLLTQVAAHHLHAGLAIGEAIAQPRWTIDGWGAAEQHVIAVEPAIEDRIVTGLRERGHRVEVADGWQAGWGPVAAIAVAHGLVEAAADPRVSTANAATG
jgi:gamma-glutamyltranspeptidase/glutathione hydrolase